MISHKIFVIFFILIILIFIICTIFISKLANAEHYSQFDDDTKKNLIYNLWLVNQFDNSLLEFNKIKKPEKTFTKYQTFYDLSIYPDLKKIDYLTVVKELENYVTSNNDWTEWPEYNLWKHKTNYSWKIIPLMAFGKWSNKNIHKFPQTVNQLKSIKGLVSAGFSKLGPNTTLKLHKGWGILSNNVLRCHLGLQVPKSKCKVFVIGSRNDMMYQKEGKWIIFDDSLYHSASNEDQSQDRIILLLDIERPDNIAKGESDIENSPELNNFIDEFNKNL